MPCRRSSSLKQIEAVARDLEVGAVKIGMLATSGIIEAVAEGLRSFPGVPVVLDPVMVAASGDPLLDEDAVETLRAVLVPLREPDHAEPARGGQASRRRPSRKRARDVGAGRGASERSAPGRADQGRPCRRGQGGRYPRRCGRRVARSRRRASTTRNTHGTGCTLSSAIAAELAKGASLREAVVAAKAYVTAAIEAADALRIGKGRGPVHHFHALWPRGAKR